MVGIGLLMAAVGMVGLWLRYRRRLFSSVWLQRAVLVMGPSGFVALLSGWVTTEVGRQPFTVYGLMRTSESVSPLGLPMIATSLIVFIVVYFFVFGAGTLILLRMMGQTPVLGEADPNPNTPNRAAGITPGPATNLHPRPPGRTGAMPAE
ncbi:MAG: cytochrome ubiquinol oxidase subunit I, partial [Gemmatimonadaceae bacterium]|nr:cytochrome ubiquinol oxidase subunit I [Acetobacteraceae bacterium]